MKQMSCALLMSLLMLLSGLNSLGQNQEQLPAGLNQSSSLSEILDWLNKNSFGQARIGLDGQYTYSYTGIEPERQVYESAVFSRGFKLIKTDGCRLTLRNDNIKILRFATTAHNYEWQSLSTFRNRANDLTPYPAEFYMRLDRLSDRGKAPYLHTKNRDDAKLLGSWRTKFKVKYGRRGEEILHMVILDLPPGAGQEGMYSASVTFTFDNKQISEQFYAAFRQAIKLCTPK